MPVSRASALDVDHGAIGVQVSSQDASRGNIFPADAVRIHTLLSMTPGTARTLRRAIPLAPAIVLTLVATIQGVMASTIPVSPWVGGGFGMFATVDGVHRVVTVDGAPVRSEAARRFAAAPFAGANHALDLAAGQMLIVWAPRYDVESGFLDFEIIAVRTTR